MKNKKMFWLVSYPKSGNTWIRAILSSLFFSNNGVFDFKLLRKFTVFDQESKYQFIKNLNKNDFKKINQIKVISKYRIEAQNLAYVGGDFAFFKTHSSNISINDNFYTNEHCTRGLIYLIIDPRDVVVSYSKHLGISIDETIKKITNEKEINYYYSIPYLMSRWDLHHKSWLNLNVPKMIIRYEDILEDTMKTIDLIINFFVNNYGFSFKNIDIVKKNILESTNITALQKLENIYGFEEATEHTNFFRKGKSNQWQKILSVKQKNKIENEFNTVMKKFKYL